MFDISRLPAGWASSPNSAPVFCSIWLLTERSSCSPFHFVVRLWGWKTRARTIVSPSSLCIRVLPDHRLCSCTIVRRLVLTSYASACVWINPNGQQNRSLKDWKSIRQVRVAYWLNRNVGPSCYLKMLPWCTWPAESKLEGDILEGRYLPPYNTITLSGGIYDLPLPLQDEDGCVCVCVG